jgi:hypothetical protein
MSRAQNMYNIKFAKDLHLGPLASALTLDQCKRQKDFWTFWYQLLFHENLNLFFLAPTHHLVTWKIQKQFCKTFSDMFVQQIQFHFTSLDIIKHTTHYFTLSVKFHARFMK